MKSHRQAERCDICVCLIGNVTFCPHHLSLSLCGRARVRTPRKIYYCSSCRKQQSLKGTYALNGLEEYTGKQTLMLCVATVNERFHNRCVTSHDAQCMLRLFYRLNLRLVCESNQKERTNHNSLCKYMREREPIHNVCRENN